MNIAFTVLNKLKWVSFGPCTVQRIHGLNPSANDLYIQLHQRIPESDGTIPNGTVPVIKSITCVASLPFEFNNLHIETACLVVVVSSTEDSYTALGEVDQALDMTVVVSSDTLCDGTEVVVGDLTNPVLHVQIWNEAGGPKRLLLVEAQPDTGEDIFLLLFATDAPNTSGIPLNSFALPDGEVTRFNFGIDGISPMAKSADQVIHQGCDLYLSTTANVATSVAPGDGYIKAVYK